MINEVEEGMLLLKKELNVLKEVIPKKSKVYFFDIPIYANVGDMIIWKGTQEYFRNNSIRVERRLTYYQALKNISNDNSWKIPHDCIIICQGGGNFGDMYPAHQDLRKILVQKYPNNKIVFLPQSIHYDNEENMEKDLDLFSKHKSLYIFTRDEYSYNLINNKINNTYLIPDMAHTLYPISYNSKINSKYLYLIRRDKENKNNYEVEKNKHFDWDDLYTKYDRFLLEIIRKIHRYPNSKFFQEFTTSIWCKFMNYTINKAVKYYAGYEIVITSRLHGHLLACLMDKETLLIDNSYGKNSRYYSKWTNIVNNVKLNNYRVK